MASIPAPIRATLGLLATALDTVQELVEHAPELPMEAVGNSMQLSLRLQQHYVALLTRGDEFLANLRGAPEEAPAWATFDESPAAETAASSAGGPSSSEQASSPDERAEDLPPAHREGEPRHAGQGDPLFVAVVTAAVPPAKTASKSAAQTGPAPRKRAAKQAAPARKVAAKTVAAKKAAPVKEAASAQKATPAKKAAPAKRATADNRIASPTKTPAKRITPAKRAVPAEVAGPQPSSAPAKRAAPRRARKVSPLTSAASTAAITLTSSALDADRADAAASARPLSAFDRVDLATAASETGPAGGESSTPALIDAAPVTVDDSSSDAS